MAALMVVWVFLWRKSSAKIKLGYKARSGRILSISLDLDSGKSINIVTVYFPCFSSGYEYRNELSECLSDIEEILTDSRQVIIAGDTNFECDVHNDGYRQFSGLLSSYNVSHCDDFVLSTAPVTYRNTSLNHSSFIDHVFVSAHYQTGYCYWCDP